MIRNTDFLFIHIPKTGGISCTEYLSQALMPPVYTFNHLMWKTRRRFNQAMVLKGLKHGTLQEAIAQSAAWEAAGVPPLDSIKQIAAVIRHPYEIELSTYNFYRNAHNNDLKYMMGFSSVKNRVRLAQHSLSKFVLEAGYYRPDLKIEDYFLIDGTIPPHLKLIRFEQLESLLPHVSRPFCVETTVNFPHRNMSGSGGKKRSVESLCSEEKEIIIQKHGWLFENGYYAP